MTNFIRSIRKKIGRFFRNVGNKVYYEPEFNSLPQINAIYAPEGMDRISIKRTFTHRDYEMFVPLEEIEEEEAKIMAIELSHKLIHYIKTYKSPLEGIIKKELTIYVDKNGED